MMLYTHSHLKWDTIKCEFVYSLSQRLFEYKRPPSLHTAQGYPRLECVDLDNHMVSQSPHTKPH